ncbi:hypothetical protein MLD38_032644 [Melastoma candidum]|uniref:Uncharacterized protein n=1 Tax=Melastoma candidum TaxID=119954 RepID=A0ACB9M4U3_9MYRT|nr:hypothetical protein MLD38_032644 [Melastoma candidum]
MATNWDEEIRWIRLKSGLRTSFACSIVGFTSLYGPALVRGLLSYSAFSYATVILIVPDANLGDGLRGFLDVTYSTILVLFISILSLRLVDPSRFSPPVAATMVTLTSFVVALPKSTRLLSKRIAFGQLVIVYVGAAIERERTEVLLHPVRVASSTMLGAAASLMSLSLPLPRLACMEIRRTCLLYADNASKRFNLYQEAFSARGGATPQDLLSQASSLSAIAKKLVSFIQQQKDGMLWERPDIRFLKPGHMEFEKRITEVELPLRGMEMALASSPSLLARIGHDELKDILNLVKLYKVQRLRQLKLVESFDATPSPLEKEKYVQKHLHNFTAAPPSDEQLPTLFFIFCVQLLQHDLPLSSKPIQNETPNSGGGKFRGYLRNIWQNTQNIRPSSESLAFAAKCSLTLGLAVLLGVLYNVEQGYWSGLIVAISFVTGRHSTFMTANARAQGTAIGSLYGVICYFIFKNVADLQFLPILPWIVVTSFLRHSRLYGESASISASIAALLILGRKHYGQPNNFAIMRAAEAAIGLICFAMVEFLFKPVRASTLAKIEMSLSCRKLKDCVESAVFCSSNMQAAAFRDFWEKQRRLKSQIATYRGRLSEAEVEPNFWFIPCPLPSYRKMLELLENTADVLQLVGMEMEILWKLSQNLGFEWGAIQDPIREDLEVVKKDLISTIECLEEVTSIKSLPELEKELQKRNVKCETGTEKATTLTTSPSLSVDNAEAGKTTSSFLGRLHPLVRSIQEHEGDEMHKSQMVLCIGSINFCLNKQVEGIRLLEDAVREIIQKENPSFHVSLSEISRKVCILKMANH